MDTADYRLCDSGHGLRVVDASRRQGSRAMGSAGASPAIFGAAPKIQNALLAAVSMPLKLGSTARRIIARSVDLAKNHQGYHH
jgi:hypothetical protein